MMNVYVTALGLDSGSTCGRETTVDHSLGGHDEVSRLSVVADGHDVEKATITAACRLSNHSRHAFLAVCAHTQTMP